jgi:glycosyltransferase involved in cell wall biosynthesis
MQEWLGGEFRFAVITRNRDLGDHAAYPDVPTDRWVEVRGVPVRYLPGPQWRPGAWRRALAELGPCALYFQSAVDFSLTVVPLVLRRLGLLARGLPVIVAPRGEFSAGARALKSFRKAVYFRVARLAGLYSGVVWHATKSEEVAEIHALWGPDADVVVAPNLPARIPADQLPLRQPKRAGTLRLVFLSRVSRMKNLDGALRILAAVGADVRLDIFGAREDAPYWNECVALMRDLPANVRVNYCDTVPPSEVIATLARYDALLLPSHGENFGHVIHEAMLAGLPVVISDRTPWRDLAPRRIGFDLPLDHPEAFRGAIERLAAMDEGEHSLWSTAARDFAMAYAADEGLVAQTRALLQRVQA